MIVYLVRHANAGKTLATERLDDARPLDEKGVEQARLMGRMLSALGEQAEVVLSSPLKRASQTASLVANELGYDGKIVPVKALRPDATYAGFRQLLEEYAGKEAIMVVGHNPSLKAFLSLLVTGDDRTDAVEMKKGAVAKVDVGERICKLLWYVTPAIAAAAYANTGTRSRPKSARK